MPQNGCRIRDITDGTSNTFLLGEISWTSMPYYRAWIRGKYQDDRGMMYVFSKNVNYPINSRNQDYWNRVAFGSLHPGGAMFAMADGSAHFISQTVDFAVYLSTASRDGGEPKSIQY
jgi:prepilin-type processing-associated H-X9-DG protein